MSRWGKLEEGIVARLREKLPEELAGTVRAASDERAAGSASKSFPATFVSWQGYTVTDPSAVTAGYIFSQGNAQFSLLGFGASGQQDAKIREKLYALLDAWRDVLLGKTVTQEDGGEYQLFLVKEELVIVPDTAITVRATYEIAQAVAEKVE